MDGWDGKQQQREKKSKWSTHINKYMLCTHTSKNSQKAIHNEINQSKKETKVHTSASPMRGKILLTGASSWASITPWFIPLLMISPTNNCVVPKGRLGASLTLLRVASPMGTPVSFLCGRTQRKRERCEKQKFVSTHHHYSYVP